MIRHKRVQILVHRKRRGAKRRDNDTLRHWEDPLPSLAKIYHESDVSHDADYALEELTDTEAAELEYALRDYDWEITFSAYEAESSYAIENGLSPDEYDKLIHAGRIAKELLNALADNGRDPWDDPYWGWCGEYPQDDDDVWRRHCADPTIPRFSSCVQNFRTYRKARRERWRDWVADAEAA